MEEDPPPPLEAPWLPYLYMLYRLSGLPVFVFRTWLLEPPPPLLLLLLMTWPMPMADWIKFFLNCCFWTDVRMSWPVFISCCCVELDTCC